MISKSQVKYIQSLNEKKFRKEEGLFVAEGPKIINELLVSNNIETIALYATGDWWLSNESLRKDLPFAECYQLAESELERISLLATPNKVLGVFRQPVFPVDLSFTNNISLLLDGIQDPGNLGTIVRIADWFGIRQIVASMDSADIFNAKVVQSSMGSIARVKITYDDLFDCIKKHNAIPVYASALNGKPLGSFGKIKEGLLLIGNESKGIREELMTLARYRVTIPKLGHAESLNAAVAAGIILSHIV